MFCPTRATLSGLRTPHAQASSYLDFLDLATNGNSEHACLRQELDLTLKILIDLDRTRDTMKGDENEHRQRFTFGSNVTCK